jgi:hypothetical protein
MSYSHVIVDSLRVDAIRAAFAGRGKKDILHSQKKKRRISDPPVNSK